MVKNHARYPLLCSSAGVLAGLFGVGGRECSKNAQIKKPSGVSPFEGSTMEKLFYSCISSLVFFSLRFEVLFVST